MTDKTKANNLLHISSSAPKIQIFSCTFFSFKIYIKLIPENILAIYLS